MITRTDRNQVFDGSGKLVEETVVEIDVTSEVVQLDLHTKVRQHLVNNATFLSIAAPNNAQNTAQIKALTRQMNAIIRLVVGNDLIQDTTNT